ncbi:hypothetical protein BDF20DRAFT_855971 [Mycotypha africana]|uniref:uncharacterized protein n=1 Tax=Mycotypha africana TaxID=64632 RepID=UPI002300593D|nr:uncharacterized protein BDF20DRAFT_855971 [Mycotypha africana]KAI8988494.1 hypothetical protein BDF20DRAFT_855971 [Mycotypha africana]
MAEATEQEDMSIKGMACKLLQQSLDLVQYLTDEQYTRDSVVMPGGTIGKHLRHANDHFRLLYKQCSIKSENNNECTNPINCIVDYDIRQRNNPSEIDRSIMMDDIKRLQTTIKQCKIPLETDVTLLAAVDAADPNKYPFKTSYGRELFYSCIHAIHHYASIKAICIEQGILVPAEFGVAPSTLQNDKNRVANACSASSS